VLALLYLLRWCSRARGTGAAGKKLSLKHCLVSLAALAAIGALVIGRCTARDTALAEGPALNDEIREAGSATAIGAGLRAMGRLLRSSRASVSAGLNKVAEFDVADITRICWGRVDVRVVVLLPGVFA